MQKNPKISKHKLEGVIVVGCSKNHSKGFTYIIGNYGPKKSIQKMKNKKPQHKKSEQAKLTKSTPPDYYYRKQIPVK